MDWPWPKNVSTVSGKHLSTRYEFSGIFFIGTEILSDLNQVKVGYGSAIQCLWLQAIELESSL